MHVALAGLLVLVSACHLVPTSCPPLSYYTFTDADRQWMNFKPQTEWTFENQRHERRVYRITSISSTKAEETLQHPYVKTLYYYDSWMMQWTQVGTDVPAGYLWMRRRPVNYSSQQSELSGELQWADYAGWTQGVVGLSPSQASSTAIIRNVTYGHVVSYQGAEDVVKYLTEIYPHPQTKRFDYDQQAGVIRFVTLNGDVWERVP